MKKSVAIEVAKTAIEWEYENLKDDRKMYEAFEDTSYTDLRLTQLKDAYVRLGGDVRTL